MKTKLDLAHDWAIKHGDPENFKLSISEAWEYADAMQAEANKREAGIAELMKDHVHDYIYGRICACGAVNGAEKEWQPDWSQAPDWANWWAVDEDIIANWFDGKPCTLNGYLALGESLECALAPSFNYQGNWQESLRKRPQ